MRSPRTIQRVAALSLPLVLFIGCTTFNKASSDAGPAEDPSDATAPATEDASADVDAMDAGGALKRVFVTSAAVPANLKVKGFDDFCAEEAGAKTGWMAWVALTGQGPAKRFRDAKMRGPWYRPGSSPDLIATTEDLLGDSGPPRIQASIKTTFAGASLDERVWTGVTFQGLLETCDDWSTNDPNVGGGVGNSAESGVLWMARGTTPCDLEAHLYCFQK